MNVAVDPAENLATLCLATMQTVSHVYEISCSEWGPHEIDNINSCHSEQNSTLFIGTLDVYFLNLHLFHLIKTDQIILFILFMNGLKC
jgi:hypothetical protein